MIKEELGSVEQYEYLLGPQLASEMPSLAVAIRLQKRLNLALSWWDDFWSRLYCYPRGKRYLRSVQDMAQYIFLIGFRVYLSGYRNHVLLIQVLIQLLTIDALNPGMTKWRTSPAGWREEVPSVGAVLDRCYQKRVLCQPENDDICTSQEQADLVVRAVDLLNLWTSRQNRFDWILDIRDLRSLRLITLFGRHPGGRE